MSLKTLDVEKLQEEFFKTASLTAYKLTKTWSETVRASGLEKVFKGTQMTWRSNGWKGPNASRATAKLQELVRMAAMDLPGLLESQQEPQKLEIVMNNWAKWYQDFVREICGIPTKSEAEHFAEQCGSFMRSFTGVGFNPGESLPLFFGMPAPPSDPRSSGFGSDPFQAWMKTSEQMMESFLSATGVHPRVQPGPIKNVLDAQTRFLNQLMAFQDLLLESSSKVVAKIMNSITSSRIQEITPETYKTLYETLLGEIERSFSEFLSSDDFARALSEAVTSGTEARDRLEGIISDWASYMNLPSGKDMDEIRETIAAMQKRIDSLEQKVEQLSRGHNELPCRK